VLDIIHFPCAKLAAPLGLVVRHCRPQCAKLYNALLLHAIATHLLLQDALSSPAVTEETKQHEEKLNNVNVKVDGCHAIIIDAKLVPLVIATNDQLSVMNDVC